MLNLFITNRAMNPKSLIILCFFITSLSTAQESGKIITSQEANNKFGAVGYFVSVPKSLFEESLKKTEKSLMFKLTDEGLVILSSNRSVIFPQNAKVSDEDIFTVYSSSIILDLLKRGEGQDLRIEQRAEVLSITFGLSTLEFGIPCPPNCN